MNLQQFVSASLVQILKGVEDARSQTLITKDAGKIRHSVIPKITGGVSMANTHGHMTSSYGEIVHLMKFDIAVTTESSSDAKGGGGIRVAGIGFGAEISDADKNINLSRVTFEVPIAFSDA